MELEAAVGDEELAAAFHHHDEGALGEIHLFEGACLLQHLAADGDIAQVGVGLFGQFHAEVVASLFKRGREAEQAGCFRHGGALHNEGDDGDEEHDVEEDVGAFHAFYHRVGGKDDGHCPAQSHPRHEAARLEGDVAEGEQAEEDAQRTAHQDHEDADEQGHGGYFEHLVGVDQQSQAEEHDDLKQPREPVHEGVDLFAVHDAVVAHHHAGDVDGQVAVASQQVGEGEGEEDEGEQQDGVEGLVVDVELVEHLDGELAEQIAGCCAYAELDDEGHGDGAQPHAARLDELDEDDGEHVGHGVVATAFELEHGPQVVLEVHLLRTEDGKHGGGVGGRHRGGQQQGGGERQVDVGPAHARQPPDEEAGEEGGEQHARGGEHDAGTQHGLDVGKLGVHSAGEQDDAQGHHADELGFFGVVKLDAEAVASKSHAHHEKEQEGRHSEAVACLADKDADKE